MLTFSDFNELERQFASTTRQKEGIVSELPEDKFDRRTCKKHVDVDPRKAERVLQIKHLINEAVAKIYNTVINNTVINNTIEDNEDNTSKYTHSALILDGSEAKTTEALMKIANVSPSSILSPNISIESASALKEVGVSAWAGRVEDFLKLVHPQPLLRLIYLDHTGAFPPRHWQVRRSLQFIQNEGVLAFTFSTRSGRWLDVDNEEVLAPAPISTWGGAEAVFALTSICKRACEEHGFEIFGNDGDELLGLQSYELNPPHPHPLVQLASALADWAVKKAGMEAHEDDKFKIHASRTHAIRAAEAASRVLHGKKVLGVVWTRTSTEEAKESRRPAQVMTESGGIPDNDVKRMIKVARDIAGLDVKSYIGDTRAAPKNFKGVVQVYPEQMMFVCMRVKKKA